MTTLKKTVLVAMIIASGDALANADEFLFITTNGKWNIASNWDLNAIPDSDDQATIPYGKTCRIEDRDESIQELIVEDGGKLEVTGRTLTIAPYGPTYHVTVDGDIEFSGEAYLEIGAPGGLRITGGGLISCTGSGNLLTVRSATGPYDTLTVGDSGQQTRPTIKGNVTILAHVCNRGRLLVDASGDVMTIGPLATTPEDPYVDLSGLVEGSFEVTSGRMKFGHCRPRPQDTLECKWRVAGGTLELTEYAAGWGQARHPVEVLSGTLEVNQFICTTGTLSFRGGQIRVAAGKAAAFTHPSE